MKAHTNTHTREVLIDKQNKIIIKNIKKDTRVPVYGVLTHTNIILSSVHTSRCSLVQRLKRYQIIHGTGTQSFIQTRTTNTLSHLGARGQGDRQTDRHTHTHTHTDSIRLLDVNSSDKAGTCSVRNDT